MMRSGAVGSEPLVSIVIPSFNQGRFLRETIESCLRQDYAALQVIVQDGGSTDETLDVLRAMESPTVCWLSEPDGGVVDAVNKGLARARGDILTIQSSDDVFLPGAVRAAVDAFSAEPTLGLLYGNVEHIDAASRVVGADVVQAFDLAAYLGRLDYIPQPGAFFSRSAMLSAGPWRASVSYAADADFWMRIVMKFPARKLDRFMAQYRYHDDQRDKHRARIARDWCRMIDDILGEHGLSPRLVRFAKMGKHLAKYRYEDESNWVRRTIQLYGAALANPASVLDPRFPRRELFPGRFPVWRFLSRVKRSVGFDPRTQ